MLNVETVNSDKLFLLIKSNLMKSDNIANFLRVKTLLAREKLDLLECFSVVFERVIVLKP